MTETNVWYRTCPSCGKSISHNRLAYRNYADKNKFTCKSCRMLGSKHPRYGKAPPPQVSIAVAEANSRRIWTKENRMDMAESVRKSVQSRVVKNGAGACFNPLACKIFDEINFEFGWHGVHALNGGEFKVLGYWLDFYEPTQNIVIEFYEKDHFKQSRIKRDIVRQNNICSHLKCQFIVIKETENWRDVLATFKDLYGALE